MERPFSIEVLNGPNYFIIQKLDLIYCSILSIATDGMVMVPPMVDV